MTISDLRDIIGVSLHAQRRARQRLGFLPTEAEWFTVVLDITGRTARHVWTKPDGAELYAVEMRGTPAEVVWSPAQGIVVTVAAVEHPKAAPSVLARRRRLQHARRERDE